MVELVLAPGVGRRAGNGDRCALMVKQPQRALRKVPDEAALDFAKRHLSYWMERGYLDPVEVAEPKLCEAEIVQAARLINRGEPLPDLLRPKVIAFLFHKGPRKKSGPDPMNLFTRDAAIVGLIKSIVQDYGLTATRSEASIDKSDSAASIVAKALRELGMKIPERVVNKIYQKFNSKKMREAIEEIQHSVTVATKKDMQFSNDPPLLVGINFEPKRRANFEPKRRARRRKN
jgi:hypothetical protein